MNLPITLLAFSALTSLTLAGMDPTPPTRLLDPRALHGRWRIDRRQDMQAGGDGSTDDAADCRDLLSLSRKGLRFGGHGYEYRILNVVGTLVQIQFWTEAGQLADGVLFLADGVLSFQYLTGEESHYFVMHREEAREDAALLALAR